MIKVNELRVGNKLLKGSFIVTIDARSIFDIWDESALYSSIPLTPEILERYGFKKEQHPNEFFWVNGNVHLSQYLNYLLYGTNAEYLWSIEIKYLHQLQNLYFALTGSELDINL